MNQIIRRTLNTLFAGVMSLSLVACCFTKPTDWSLSPVVKPYKLPKNQRSENYPDNFLGCRAEINEQSLEDKARVAKIISNIENSKKDVVLYFHGGLSGQDYMINKLGDWLMTSVFDQEPNPDLDPEKVQLKDRFYPIFLSYDAAPKDTLPEIPNKGKGWKTFEEKTNDLMVDNFYKEFETEFISIFKYENLPINDIDILEKEWAAKAYNIVSSAAGRPEINALVEYQLTNEERKYFEEILSKNKIPNDILSFTGTTLATTALNKLTALMSKLRANKSLEINSLNNLSAEQKYYSSKLRVLRILARFALKVDHGFVATFQEELLEVLKIGALGKAHWNVVKKHAKQCFSEGRLGRYLIEELIKSQEKRSFEINTLSHSAGSIPTSELINYLAYRTERSLNSVVMLVPAINQEVFTKFVLPNKHVYEKLELYSLTKKMERKDKVFNSLLYSSSLLYAVSSLAENSPMLDNMLLIQQHMRPRAFPYRYKTYQCVVGEKPKHLWQAIKPEQTDSGFITYPFPGVQKPKDGAATHENTKYPWLSDDLARSYLKTLGYENADELVFYDPRKK